MKRMRSFIGLTLFGGLMVVLPMTIFILLVGWLLGVVTSLISPLSELLTSWTPIGKFLADLLGIVIVLAACFVIGLLIRTKLGGWLHDVIDQWLTRLAPGYKTIREVVMQFLGGEGNTSLLKGQVCRAYLMGRATGVSVTGVVTSIHANGDYTVYVPTAPIPTSGFVYHLSAECVDLLPHISVETAMRTVIACGSGSHTIFDATHSQSIALQTPD